MTTSTKRRTGHREGLLRAAMVCLRDKGYARTTARDLVAASGTNLASIGYHFGSKEALLHEAIAQSVVEWMRGVGEEVFTDQPATTAERLERSLAATVDRFGELEPYLLAFVEAFPQAIRSEDLRDRMATAYREARGEGAEMLQRSLAGDGVAIDAATGRTLSALMMALTDGLILLWLLDRRATPGSRETMEALGALGPALRGAARR